MYELYVCVIEKEVQGKVIKGRTVGLHYRAAVEWGVAVPVSLTAHTRGGVKSCREGRNSPQEHSDALLHVLAAQKSNSDL